MVKSLPTRLAVPVGETWDLSNLFNSSKDFDQALESLEQEAEALNHKTQGTITDVPTTIQTLTDYMAFLEKLVIVSTYASLTISTDQTNNEAQLQSSKFSAVAAKISSKLSFINSELLALPRETLEQAMQESAEFKGFLEKLLRKKPYQLHPEVEKTLAAYSSTFSAPYGLYNTTKMVDMNFEDFEVNGQAYPLSYVSFEGDWEAEPDTELRRAAFDAFSKKLKDYQHTTAKTYDMQLQTEKTTADLRGYDSIFDYLLSNQEVDRSLYNRQIDLITKELAPHMQKYAKLLQKVNGLDRMTFADLKISLDPSYEPEITVEESKNYIDGALSIMGPDYIEMVNRSYSERWIDFAQNKGKSTGAFCSSPYGVHPYILISWTGRMNEVFVLAHELGHAGHFYNANREQNIFNARPSLYFIEAPSTMNEMLVANHLLKNSEDLKFKRWVISSIVARTYYHNFVTHLLEAAYQRKVYERIDGGQSVNAGILNTIKRGVLEEFWGDSVDITDGAELTWMRQPHYYMGLYPYTYSAGLTISTQVSKRILNEGQTAVDEWLEVLKAGGTKTPVELAQMAGVDITTEQPLRDTIAYIGELVDELVRLTEEIEAG
ncbi:oligoendopeptidase F-like protein [Planococcus antarcticus DSM 14505]|uniref:Oligopeptidase F n=1 Tax=Planococcus antarcticus DSM 14505 TaxID=1185653 RepID=A0A1C7DC15_9BACL|nr:oligoendopeptidase F [Planococcus antarcticus]ANU09040.1 oligoendopeptidase F [Planococcus antarcticus DSM 14505]EIM07294.1 oligoendopeptidase F-like protein [Planococcus antarcticus DSM 14505]